MVRYTIPFIDWANRIWSGLKRLLEIAMRKKVVLASVIVISLLGFFLNKAVFNARVAAHRTNDK